MKDQKTGGALLAYLNIVLSMLSNIVLIPVMIAYLSDTHYSIYKVMQSFAGPLTMFNLGIATIASRCVAKYRACGNGDPREKENTLAITMIVGAVMAALIGVLGLLLRQAIPHIFAATCTAAEIRLAQNIFLVFAANTAVHVLTDVFSGCIQGNERFLFANGIRTMQHILRFALMAALLYLGFGAVAVVLVDLGISVLILTASALYSFLKLHERFRLTRIDRREIMEIASFAAAILLQAVINQVNNSLDNVILGATVTDKAVITMYSSALSIYLIYNTLLSVFSGMFLPEATRMVMSHSTGEELTALVIRIGRIQAMIAVGVVGGFALAGRDFIRLWIGDAYIQAYEVVLMLIIPVTIPLVQNTCITILDAQLKRFFRSAVLTVMAGLNFVISLILVRFMGFWGAALGTVLSLIAGHGILMNVYYHRVIGLNVPRMFRGIFSGILPAGLLALALSAPLHLFLRSGWVSFLAKAAVFAAVYGALLWKMGMDDNEKMMIRGFLRPVSGHK